MATDVEKLVVQLSADVRSYQRDLLKAQGVTNSTARAIERRYMDMNKRLDGIGKSAANSIIAPLAGISAALTANEVLKYADAWTSAKNSLAVAGITGQKQADVLDQLFKSAQANATPIGALTDLFGKAAQASDNLGASTEDLLKFSDGVAVSLKVAGASAESASGALQQLGQLLGSAKVQAEEFNSVNDGARPILLAVAKGLDAAGGSVNKLKQIVNAGQLSGKQFFDAFLKGLPAIQAMAANSTQTISQGFTKINNALTKYIGETDSSLGASQRLVQGLNALADNFGEVADITLKVAAVIGGALVGRAITGMIASLVLAGLNLKRFIGLIKAAQTIAQTGFALRGLATFAGPIGAAIGIAATAIELFGNSADEAIPSTEAYAKALEKVKAAAEDTGKAVDDATAKLNERRKNDLALGADEAVTKIAAARAALVKYLQAIQDNAPRKLISEDELKELAKLQDGLKEGSKTAEEADNAIAALANSNPKFQKLADQIRPLIDALKEAVGVSKELKVEQAKLGDTSANLTHPSGDTVFTETKAQKDFIDQHNAEIARNELEKEIDTRSKAIIAAAAKVGVTLNEAAAKIQAKSDMLKEGSIKAIDSSISGFADRVIGAESNGKVDAKNPNSSATGVGQFIESTWLSLFRKYFPEQAASMSRDAILELRKDSGVSRQLIEAYARENAAILQKAGVSVDEASLQLAHFLGPQGAVNVLKAAPGTPVSKVLDAGAIKANQSILGNGATVDDVIAYAQKRAGMTTAGTKTLDSRDDFAKDIKDQQQQLAALKEETGIRASLNPLIEDYGKKLSEIQKAQELFNLAEQEGTAAGKELTSAQQLLNGDISKLSPEAQKQALAMRELATNYGAATAASNQLQASQEKLKTSVADFNATARDVVGGALTDIRTAMEDGKITAKEWGDILVNALNKVADKLQDMLLNQLFPSSGTGGLLGSLFGSTTSAFNPATASPGLFDKGGYTGPGGKYQPAGIVHKGEYVFDQEAVKRIGIGNLKMLQGYADGGLVGSMPSIPTIGAARPGYTHITVGLRKDGLNLYPEIDSVATGRAAQAAGAVGQKFDRWRTNGFHSDVEKHIANRRVTGK